MRARPWSLIGGTSTYGNTFKNEIHIMSISSEYLLHLLIHFIRIRFQELYVVLQVRPAIYRCGNKADGPDAGHQCCDSERTITHSNQCLTACASYCRAVLAHSWSGTDSRGQSERSSIQHNITLQNYAQITKVIRLSYVSLIINH